jgi:hypothetical protein
VDVKDTPDIGLGNESWHPPDPAASISPYPRATPAGCSEPQLPVHILFGPDIKGTVTVEQPIFVQLEALSLRDAP